jgi:hypothetical protein
VVAVTGATASVEEVSSALISRRTSPKVNCSSSSDCLSSNLFLSKDGLDIKDSVFGEGGGSIVVIELELPVASSGQGDVVSPSGEVKEIKVVLEDQLA